MSKFFRSADSSSSSESDSEDEDKERENQVRDRAEDLSLGNASNSTRAEEYNAVERVTPASINNHRDNLLHALLEERCMNEVLESYANVRQDQRPGRDSPEIQAEANAKYRQLCAQLASYNLISTGLEEDQHAMTRQRYRDGLDVLSQQRATTTTAVAPTFKRLLTDSDGAVALPADVNNAQHERLVSPQLRRLLTGSETAGPEQSMPLAALNNALGIRNPTFPRPAIETRYHNEYEELSTLGRGGYGIVYNVRHRLDGQKYAVKKVPLSLNRLQRIRNRGHSELEEVLRELRTLAQLDHPNIVRYYNGWIEWVDATSSPGLAQSDGASRVFGSTDDVSMGANDTREDSLRRVITESSIEKTDVVFELSDVASAHATSGEMSTNDDQDLRLRRVGTKSTTATVSDDIIESVGRDVDASMSIQSAASGVNFSEPTLAVHMQMSLHAMTLADFVAPPKPSDMDGTAPALSHCFHPQPSLSILLAILDGLEYLHHKNIVHRDIKAANILLGPHSNPCAVRGAVDLLLCKDCHAEHTANPISLEVRIGDFGLVSVADPQVGDVAVSAAEAAVGTEMYRPTTAAQSRSPGLDIYALGIVAFELLWKFDTRMERLQTIQKLKGENEFPGGFCEGLGVEGAARVKECIKAMLSCEGEGISIQELRRELLALQMA